jgi:protein involved in sex pheromone biosynthesis
MSNQARADYRYRPKRQRAAIDKEVANNRVHDLMEVGLSCKERCSQVWSHQNAQFFTDGRYVHGELITSWLSRETLL